MYKKILKWFRRNKIVESPKDRLCIYCKKPLIEGFGIKTPNCPDGMTICPDFHYVEHRDAEGNLWIDTNGGKPIMMRVYTPSDKEEK